MGLSFQHSQYQIMYMYMYKHVIQHRSIKYIWYRCLGLCNINKQYIFQIYTNKIIIKKTCEMLRLKIYQKQIHWKRNCSKWNHETGVACWEGPWQCMLGDCHGFFYRMIWFLQLPAKDLSGNTMAFSSITSEGTWTLLPMRSKTTGAWRNSWQTHI